VNTTKPLPRALTREELKLLRKAGLDPAFLDGDTTVKVSVGMVDWILDHVYQNHDFTNTPYPECLELATKTYKLTYGLNQEVKNS